MATCPLIDYVAWAPFTLAVIAAALVASAGLVRRDGAMAARAIDLFAAVLLGGSVVSVIAIIGLKGGC